MNQLTKKWIFFTLVFLNLPLFSFSQCSCCHITKKEATEYIDSAERWDMLTIPMRDGVNLNAMLLFPIGMEKQDLPTVLIRTPYHLWNSEIRWFAAEVYLFLKNGYAVMLSTERGRYWSDGEYTFLVGARKDGYDVVDWISKQAWSNGSVATFGCSSGAEHQLGLATMDHPAHKAMISLAAGAGIGEAGPYHDQGMFYRGGVPQMAFMVWYYLRGYNVFPDFGEGLTTEQKIRLSRYYDMNPNRSNFKIPEETFAKLPYMGLVDTLGGMASDFTEFARLHPNSKRWHDVEFAGNKDSFGVPCLHLNSWYDASFGPTSMEVLRLMQDQAYDSISARNQYMIIMPKGHCAHCQETEHTKFGERDVGDARFDYFDLYIKWLDYWCKGVASDVLDRKTYQLYTMGKNQWEYFDNWPPEGFKEQSLYFTNTKSANSRFGDGKLVSELPLSRSDTFTYDPGNPVPSHGDSHWFHLRSVKSGTQDQSENEERKDVLVYTSPVLDSPVQMTGPVYVTVYLSSDVRDTDLAVKLVDVYPSDTAFNVAQSIQRVRWRQGYEEAVFMEKDSVYKVTIGPLLTSNMFLAGHRIRIEVTGSNFPMFERNLNTGGNNYDETAWMKAHNRIHHGEAYPSRIVFYSPE